MNKSTATLESSQAKLEAEQAQLKAEREWLTEQQRTLTNDQATLAAWRSDQVRFGCTFSSSQLQGGHPKPFHACLRCIHALLGYWVQVRV
jgi:hypothetical protein